MAFTLSTKNVLAISFELIPSNQRKQLKLQYKKFVSMRGLRVICHLDISIGGYSPAKLPIWIRKSKHQLYPDQLACVKILQTCKLTKLAYFLWLDHKVQLLDDLEYWWKKITLTDFGSIATIPLNKTVCMSICSKRIEAIKLKYNVTKSEILTQIESFVNTIMYRKN